MCGQHNVRATARDNTGQNTKDTQTVPGYKLKFLALPGIEPSPPSWNAILPTRHGDVHHEPSSPVVPWLSYSPQEPRFAGTNPAGVDRFFSKCTNPEYDFLRKGSKAVGPVS